MRANERADERVAQYSIRRFHTILAHSALLAGVDPPPHPPSTPPLPVDALASRHSRKSHSAKTASPSGRSRKTPPHDADAANAALPRGVSAAPSLSDKKEKAAHRTHLSVQVSLKAINKVKLNAVFFILISAVILPSQRPLPQK